MPKEISDYQLLNDRIIDLESQLAFQEHTIHKLNDVVTAQQNELMRFKKQLLKIARQLENQSANTVADTTQESPPPHY